MAVTLFLLLFLGCARKTVLQTTPSASSISRSDSVARGSTNLHRLFDHLEVGMSEQQVASTVEPLFHRAERNTYLNRYPFRDLLPEVDPRAVTEWRTTHLGPDGWAETVFAVFTDADKTNLVDAFFFKDGTVTPVVDGLFDRNVRAVKPGDSVEGVYQRLGKRNAEYFRSPDANWRVKLIYWGHRGRIFVIEIDAAEGRVVRVGEGTI